MGTLVENKPSLKCKHPEEPVPQSVSDKFQFPFYVHTNITINNSKKRQNTKDRRFGQHFNVTQVRTRDPSKGPNNNFI